MVQISNVYTNMGPIWGRQDPGGPYGGSMSFAIWEVMGKQVHPVV